MDLWSRPGAQEMTRGEIKRRFPNASETFIRANADQGGPPRPEPKQAVRPRPHRPVPGKAEDRPRYAISIVAHRRRLIDPDNLAPKFFIDALRYAGVIVDDAACLVDYSIRQQKTREKEDFTVITIVPLDN
jgi:hypothetical protein